MIIAKKKTTEIWLLTLFWGFHSSGFKVIQPQNKTVNPDQTVSITCEHTADDNSVLDVRLNNILLYVSWFQFVVFKIDSSVSFFLFHCGMLRHFLGWLVGTSLNRTNAYAGVLFKKINNSKYLLAKNTFKH